MSEVLAFACGAATGLVVGWHLWGRKLRLVRQQLKYIAYQFDKTIGRLGKR